MACELAITDAGSANVEITSFSSAVGQGNTTHKAGHPIEYGFAANASTMTAIVQLNIGVSGDALTVGATYTAPDSAFIDLTINNVVDNTGAGDACDEGFLLAGDPHDAAQRAQAAAARCVTLVGALP